MTERTSVTDLRTRVRRSYRPLLDLTMDRTGIQMPAAVKRYRKKPVVIDAVQWDGTVEDATLIIDWVLSGKGTARYHGPVDGDPDCPNQSAHPVRKYCPTCSYVAEDPAIAIDTLEGVMRAAPDDYVIRGVQGEHYPCKPDIFEQTYGPE